jgi:hypothetical protein
MTEACFWFIPPVNSSAFHKNDFAFRLCLFREIKQEETGQVLFFPLALRGKAFGFNSLINQTVITPAISDLS